MRLFFQGGVMMRRCFYLAYIVLRLGEAAELGHLSHVLFQNIIPAATTTFLFLFALAIVLVDLRRLGRRTFVFWHFVMELFLLPLALHHAWSRSVDLGRVLATASTTVPVTQQSLFVGLIVTILFLQFLMAMAGHNLLVWLAEAPDAGAMPQSPRRTSGQALPTRAAPPVPQVCHPSSDV